MKVIIAFGIAVIIYRLHIISLGLWFQFRVSDWPALAFIPQSVTWIFSLTS